MRKWIGLALLLVAIVGLSAWGAQVQGPRIEAEVRTAAEAVVAGTRHPMEVTVSGRDITLSGTADTESELSGLLTSLDQVQGRRVVRATDVTVIPVADPYDTALAKGADGSFGMTGTVPSAVAAETLEAAGLTGAATLPLASGAPEGWTKALTTGAAALGPLEEGSFALTGTTAILNGIAATSAEAGTARDALAALPKSFEAVTNIAVVDPGVVTFELRYDPVRGVTLSGDVPENPGASGIATALGLPAPAGEAVPTVGEMPALGPALDRLRGLLPMLDALTLRVENGEIASVIIAPMPGLDPDWVAGRVGQALAAPVTVTEAPTAPAGESRVNLATGETEVASAGYWLPRPGFAVSGAACNEEVARRMEGRQIRFVTGSAELDAASLGVINDVAGVVLHCTKPLGMNVVIGGHTDSEGDDIANYRLSVERANAVRAALIERGVPGPRMVAIGHGETEPIASNDTAEGRAMNRRTTFDWPE